MLCATIVSAAGCQNTSRLQNAQARWENKAAQIRLEAAYQAMAEERYTCARHLLEPLTQSPQHSLEAQRLLAEIHAARQTVARRVISDDDSDLP